VIARGRVVRAEEGAAEAERLLRPAPSSAQRRRIAREVLAAQLEAEQIVEAATARADAILAEARATAAEAAATAAREAEKAEQAKLAALYLALRGAEEAQADRALERNTKVAVLLAERLLGASLELDPPRIAHLAREALGQARGARRVRIEAHPLDAEALSAHLSSVGLPAASVEVVKTEGLARGELCLHTDLGTLDAKLTPQLERLAEALREALR
jgi:flagellar biosynthesis/type III secretory pathway protein FliH